MTQCARRFSTTSPGSLWPWDMTRTPPRFPRAPSNFPRVPEEASAAAFKEDRILLDAEHEALHAAVADFDMGRLAEQPTPRAPTFAQLIVGVAAHDTHHTGQIQLLKRLHRDGKLQT